MAGVRRQARCLALEVLYEIDCASHSASEVLQERLDGEWPGELDDKPLPVHSRPFVYQLVNGVLEHREALDRLIQEYAPEWPIDQIAIIDRNLLRMAIFEFIVSRMTPTRVAINEAVSLAKDYGSDNASRFVNGVLGSVAAREEELKALFPADDPRASRREGQEAEIE